MRGASLSKHRPKGKTGRADIALNLINKLYGVERDLTDSDDEDRKAARMGRSPPLLTQVKNWVENSTSGHDAECLGQGHRLLGQQLEQIGTLRRARLLTDRQQRSRACDPPICHQEKELVVQ